MYNLHLLKDRVGIIGSLKERLKELSEELELFRSLADTYKLPTTSTPQIVYFMVFLFNLKKDYTSTVREILSDAIRLAFSEKSNSNSNKPNL